MIALRWLKRDPVPYGEPACVLQFRTGYHSRETGLDTWEEWQNVPTVNQREVDDVGLAT